MIRALLSRRRKGAVAIEALLVLPVLVVVFGAVARRRF